MLPDLYVQFARYNEWMNERVHDLAGKLDHADRVRDLGAFFGSVHLTLTHLLITDRAWLARLTADPKQFRFLDSEGRRISVSSSSHDVYPDFEDLRLARRETDSRLIDFAGTLTHEALTKHIQYVDSSGKRSDHPIWFAVSHLFNHQTHHRGQVTTLLKQLGLDPGVTDLGLYLRGEV